VGAVMIYRKSYALLTAALLSCTATLLSCGGATHSRPYTNDSTCSAATAVSISAVNLSDYSFEPACVQLGVGEQLAFLNLDPNPNVIVADATQPEPFVSGVIPAGGVFTHVFNTVGTIQLTSSYYVGMRGTVIVNSP
jgi:plastocyanin